MEIILSIILLIVIWVDIKGPSYKANNRVCPPGMEIDWNRMTSDRFNGMSQRDIDIKYCNGGYDVPISKK